MLNALTDGVSRSRTLLPWSRPKNAACHAHEDEVQPLVPAVDGVDRHEGGGGDDNGQDSGSRPAGGAGCMESDVRCAGSKSWSPWGGPLIEHAPVKLEQNNASLPGRCALMKSAAQHRTPLSPQGAEISPRVVQHPVQREIP